VNKKFSVCSRKGTEFLFNNLFINLISFISLFLLPVII